MHDSWRQTQIATHLSTHKNRARSLERRFETLNQTHEELCVFNQHSVFTCGIRRDPLAFTPLPPHMVNEDGVVSLGVQTSIFGCVLVSLFWLFMLIASFTPVTVFSRVVYLCQCLPSHTHHAL